MKFYVKLLKAFIFKFRLIIISGIFFGIIISTLFFIIQPKINIISTSRIGYTGRYTTDNLPFEISSKISKGLVYVETSSEIKPLLAKSWTIEDEGKKWKFDIDIDTLWHDGKHVSVNDLQFNFEDVNITRSETEIVFELNDPYIPFITLLESPVFKKGLMGTGEWKVKKLSVKGEYFQQIVLSNKNKKEIYKFYPTEEQTRLAFKMGEIDKIYNISSKTSFSNWNNINIDEKIKSDQVVLIFFNCQDPVLTEKNIRQALNYSLDKKIFQYRAVGPISEHSYYFNPQIKMYELDKQKAKELLENSEKDIPNDYTLKLITTPNLVDTADSISKMWREIGINSSVLISSVIPSDYQAFLTIFDIPKDPDQYSLWHSTQSDTNISKYKNLRIDKLLEEGRVEINKEERKKIYLDFQRFLIEDSPAIFLYHPVWYNISRKN